MNEMQSTHQRPPAVIAIEIVSSTLDPADVTRIIERRPSYVWMKDAPVPLRARGGRTPAHQWVIEVESDDMEEAARALLLQLQGRQQAVREAAEKYAARVSLRIGWEAGAAEGFYSLPSDVMIQIASMTGSIFWDFSFTGTDGQYVLLEWVESGVEKNDGEGRYAIVIPRQAIVGLVLTSATLDPAEVTRVIGLAASRQHAKGAILPGRSTREPCGLWALESEGVYMDEAVQALLSQLRGRQQAVREAAEKCSASVSLRVRWEPEPGRSGFGFSPELLIELASFVSRVDQEYSLNFPDLDEMLKGARRLEILLALSNALLTPEPFCAMSAAEEQIACRAVCIRCKETRFMSRKMFL